MSEFTLDRFKRGSQTKTKEPRNHHSPDQQEFHAEQSTSNCTFNCSYLTRYRWQARHVARRLCYPAEKSALLLAPQFKAQEDAEDLRKEVGDLLSQTLCRASETPSCGPIAALSIFCCSGKLQTADIWGIRQPPFKVP